MGACVCMYRFLVFISTKLPPGNEELPFLIFLRLLCILEGFVLRELSVWVVWKWWEWTGCVHRTQSWGWTACHKTHVKALVTVWGHVHMSGGPWRWQEGGWFPGGGITSSSELPSGSWESNPNTAETVHT